MNASDSICVRSRRIQGVSIARKRWRYRRRNLRKDSLETGTRDDRGTEMLEKECERESGELDWDERRRRIAALSKDRGHSLRSRSQKIERKILRAYAQTG